MKRAMLLTTVLCAGCYYLMGNEVRQGIAASHEALLVNKPAVAVAYLEPTREIAGEPKTIPPLDIGAANYWAAQVRAKAARLRKTLLGFLQRFGVSASLGGGGIGALLLGWALKNKRQIKRMATALVENGEKLKASANGDGQKLKDIQDEMKARQDALGIRSAVQVALKEKANGV